MLEKGTKVFRCDNKEEVGYVLCHHKYGFNVVWWPDVNGVKENRQQKKMLF